MAILSIVVNIFDITSPDFTTNWQTYVVTGMQCVAVVCALAMLFGTRSSVQAAYGVLSLILIMGFIMNRAVTGDVISLIGSIITLACLSLVPPSKRYLLPDCKKEETAQGDETQAKTPAMVLGDIPPHEFSGKKSNIQIIY